MRQWQQAGNPHRVHNAYASQWSVAALQLLTGTEECALPNKPNARSIPMVDSGGKGARKSADGQHLQSACSSSLAQRWQSAGMSA
jgi:hypothetical protein